MSLGSAITNAFAGLKATQSRLAVTSQNIANAGQAGYTRKSMEVAETLGDSGSSSSVRTSLVQRNVDQMLRDTYWQKSSEANFAEKRAVYAGRLDSYFGQLNDKNGLPSLVNNLNGSLIKLVSDPASPSAQANVVSHARTLASELNAGAEYVQALRRETETGITEDVDRVNNLLREVSSLEKDIVSERAKGISVAALDDQMDMKLEELSKYLDINVHRDNDGELRISTVSGMTLYDVKPAQLSFVNSPTLGAGVEGNPVEIVTPSGQRSTLQPADFRGGTIGASLKVRDSDLPEAQTRLDELASQMALALSREEAKGAAADDGLTPPEKTGLAVNLSGIKSSGDKLELSFVDASGAKRELSFIAVKDPALLPLAGEATAKGGDLVYGLDLSDSAPDLATQIGTALGASFEVSDAGGGAVKILADPTKTSVKLDNAVATNTRTITTQDGLALPMFVDSEHGGIPFTGALEEGGQKTGFAHRITVNDQLVRNPALLSGMDKDGSGFDSARALFLKDSLSTARFHYSSGTGIGSREAPYSGTISDFANQVIARQGQLTSQVNAQKTASESGMNVAKKAYEMSYKVDVDTELVNLMELQNAFAANARVLDVSNKLFDQLMQAVR
ncbi:flagellar hook-associated protein FlgK [Polycladidibacter hongkongensis]|uniref:flagellar hook-associated protein FlgK n=1 Tax=Polycladidibacter hongkongensis TaxID=1647556 RepID=UPI000830556D|nr:flagellar hook-associated protein FlgK [Pseudovibrio hongkongensis]